MSRDHAMTTLRTHARLLTMLALALATWTGCASEGRNTQVVVEVDAERGVRLMANTLIVRVYKGRVGEDVPSTVVFERPFDVGADGGTWPRTVALAPQVRGDVESIYRFEAAAYREGSPTADSVPIATIRLISGYARDQTLRVRLVLQDACIGVLCGLDETCDLGGCVDAHVDPGDLSSDAGMGGMDGGGEMDAGAGDGGPICDPAMCDDNLACTTDFCETDGTCGHTPDDSVCDDGAECTMDSCVGDGGDANGCLNEPRTGEPCTDDGSFCNGVETCDSTGACVGSGDPCTAPTTCSGDRCVGCTSTSDCPTAITTPGVCSYATTCAESGSASDVVTTFSCVSGECQGTDMTTARACARTTAGTMCGMTTYTEWVCGGFASTCDETGTETRTQITHVCASGSCMPMGTTQTQPCSRSTSGAGCDDGDGCTGPDVCSGGLCTAGPNTCGDAGGPICSGPGDCDDFRDCTIDSCVSGGTLCQHQPDDARCPTPFNPCIVPRCAPGNPSADPYTGCYDDTSGCITADGGVSGECTTSAECDDFDPCTVDTCVTTIVPYYCDHFWACMDAGSASTDAGVPGPRG